MDGDGIDEDTTTHETFAKVLHKIVDVVAHKETDGFVVDSEPIPAEALDENNYLFGFSMSNKKTSEETTFEVGTVS